jgi:hypothetical protein
MVAVPSQTGLSQINCWVTAPTPLAPSADSSAGTPAKKPADTAGDSGSQPERRAGPASGWPAGGWPAESGRPPPWPRRAGSAVTAGLVSAAKSGEHWQSELLAVTTWTRGAPPGSKCSQKHRGEAAGTDGRRQEPGELPRGHGRGGGRDGPPAVRPEHGPDRPEAGDRGLLRLQPGRQPRRGGLAQMILRLGQLAVTVRNPAPLHPTTADRRIPRPERAQPRTRTVIAARPWPSSFCSAHTGAALVPSPPIDGSHLGHEAGRPLVLSQDPDLLSGGLGSTRSKARIRRRSSPVIRAYTSSCMRVLTSVRI